jgi:hypothetical protein
MIDPTLTKDEVKQVYLSCEMKDPDGLYADEVELYELTKAIEKRVALKFARAERAQCIKFVQSLNTEVARALSEKRGQM